MTSQNVINSRFPINIAAGGTGSTTVPANGQTLIGNGTSYTVASLTAGAGITTTAGVGSLTIGAKNFVLLSSQSPGTVASVDFNIAASTGFENFYLVWQGSRPTTAGGYLIARISTDGGATYKNTGYSAGATYSAFNSTVWANTNDTTAFVLSGPNQAASSVQFANGAACLFNTAGNVQYLTGSISFFLNGGTFSNGAIGGSSGFNDATNLQLTWTSGTTNGGIYRLYGLQNS